MGEEWFKQKKWRCCGQFTIYWIYIWTFFRKRLLNTSTPNLLFGLVDSLHVSIVADLKFGRLTILRHGNIWVLKYHCNTKYSNFLHRLIGIRHIKPTKAQIQKIKTDVNDNDFNVDTLYELNNMFNDNFYLKKKDFVLDQKDHLNFKFEIDSKNEKMKRNYWINKRNSVTW